MKPSTGLRLRPSPNFDTRPPGQKIDTLIVHYTDMIGAEPALARLRDPEAKVSAHYLIDEDGTVFRMVEEVQRAWHAGVSFWAGQRDINGCSIGIELVNPGHQFGYRAFPKPQIAALKKLALEICARHPIPPWRVLGHSDVAPTRKRDPGELFPWESLAKAGIGLWPKGAPAHLGEEETPGLLLARYGYEIADEQAAWVAFQRHFRPALCDGIADEDSLMRLRQLLRLAGR